MRFTSIKPPHADTSSIREDITMREDFLKAWPAIDNPEQRSAIERLRQAADLLDAVYPKTAAGE